MAGEELEIVRLRNDFYRDGFYKVFILLAMLLSAIILLLIGSLYLFTTKPPPVSFYTDNDLRAFPPVPVSKPYIKQADLIQWVSQILPQAFTFDFVNYNDEIKQLQPYFTPRGWSTLLTQVDIYANPGTVQTGRQFVNASANGTPTIPNQGLLGDKYGWWIQMPLTIHKLTLSRHDEVSIVIQALVVRVPTLNNLTGIQIDNIIVQGTQGQAGPPGPH
ncbi:MAG: DotI/IcmL/TraM family protein [Pseudomonadota bacterium]